MTWTKKLGIVLLVTGVLNLFDLFLTWHGISKGYAQELNPFMAWSIRHGFLVFFVVKNALCFGGLWWLWYLKWHHPRVVTIVASFNFAFYVTIMFLHALLLASV